MNIRFHSIEELKTHIVQLCGDKVADHLDQLGYIEAGHGLRGKQRWLVVDSDLEEMYTFHKGKKEILLWCFGPDLERQREPLKSASKTFSLT